jgi:hypothetical protein
MKIFKKYTTITVAVIVLILLFSYMKPGAARAAAEAGLRISHIVKESMKNFALSMVAAKKNVHKHKPADVEVSELEGYKYRRAAMGISLGGGGAAPIPMEDRIIKLGPEYGEEEMAPGFSQATDIAAAQAETKLPPGIFPIMTPPQNKPVTTPPSQPPSVQPPQGISQTGAEPPTNILSNYGYPTVPASTGTILPLTANNNTPATPIPSPLLLLASCLVGLVGMRLRQTR